MMKCYEYLRLRPYCGANSGLLSIATTEPETLEAILSEVRQLIPRVEVQEYKDLSGRILGANLSKLNDNDTRIFYWIVGWLGKRGWEPYAVGANLELSGSGVYPRGIAPIEVHHFRKETTQVAP